MEYVLLALLILAYLFVTPLAAWVSARRTRARVAVLEDTVVRQAQELAQLRARLQQQTRTSEDVAVAAVAREVTPPSVVPEPVEEPTRQEPVSETAPAVEEAPVVATLPTPAPEAPIEPIAPPPELIPTVETPMDVEAPPVDAGVPAVTEAPQVAAREITQPPAALREDSGPAVVGPEGPRIPPPPPAPPSEPEPPSPGFDWEGLVGVKLFSAIAGIALVLAAIFFLRYSMEHGWLQPPIRVIIGVVIGVGLLVVCEFKAARRYPYTANALDAAAIAILFATFFAAHALWNLIPALATFVLLAMVTGVAVLLSIRRESLFIAVLGLLGGFSTPALLSTGENRPIPLFAYLMLLNVGLAWVAYRQAWPALTWLTLIFTTLYQWGWVWRFLHESSLSLAMGVFLVFPIVTVIGLMLSRREVPDEGSSSTDRHFERTATLSAALPLLFAAYLATIPAYSASSPLLFGFLLLIDLGLFAVSLARRQHVLHAVGALSTLFITAEWLSTSYAPDGSLTVPLFAASFAVLYVMAPSVARWLERPLEGAAAQARYAAPVLLFVFPIVARIDPAFSSPLALFGVLLGLVVLIAWRAIATEDGPLYYVAAFFAIAAQASWSATHLTSARLGTAVAIYVVFGLVSIATPALARRAEKPLEPAWGSGAVLLVSLVLLLFLSLGPVTPAALWAMALLLAILNAGLFVESAYGGLPIVSQAGSLFSWLILASWWLRAAASIGVLPSLTVLAGLTLVTLGGHAWAAMHADHPPSTRTERGFSQGLYLGVIGHLFLLFLALNREWALPPWPLFATLAVITLATTAVSLVTRRAWLHGAGVIAAAIVVAGWAWAAGDPRWGLIAILASAAVTAYALAWIRPATARWAAGPTSIAAGAVLFVAEAAVLLAVYGGATPPFPALVIAHVVNISLILALTHLRRWKYVAILAVLPAWLAVGQFQVVDVRLLDWARLLEISGALYAVFIAYPIVLGQRVGGDRDPYLAAVLMSGIFLIASRVAFSIGNFDWAIGIVPVGEGAILALLLRSLLRMEPAGQRDTGRLVLVAGAALAFATVAIPLQLKQQWITIGWALEGAALAWLYRRVRHRGLLYFTAGLLGTVFVRLAMNPEILVYEPRGAMRIFNWYLYAYAICAVAMFVAAYWLSSTEDRLVTGLPRLSQVLPAAGVILLFLLLNIEIADYYASGPTIAFRFGAAVSQDLTYTIAWLIFGMALLAVGIAMRNRAARLTAVILITITTLKCFLYDLSSLGGLYRVASFVGLALSLALVSLALQKFVLSKPKGTGMIRVGGFTGTALCLATAMLGAQSSGTALHFTRERTITSVGRGPQRLAIDTTLLEGAKPFRIGYYGDRAFAEDGLADLRLFDAQGAPVPHLLVYPPRQPSWIAGTILAVSPTKKTSGFEVDLHRADDVDMIRVEGLPAPFLKRLTLEGSGDRAHWTMLVAEGTLFDLPDDKLRQTDLPFARGAYRYLRITWDDTNSGRVPVPRGAFARQVAGPAPPPVPSAALTIERRPSEPGRSRYRIRLPAPRLPIVALELDVAGAYVFRPAVVTESRISGAEAIPAQLGNATLIRVVRDGAAAQALRIPIEPPLEAEMELLVEDGSNPALDLKGVSAVFAELPWIYFEAPDGPVTARFGDRTAQPPHYDLEAARESIDIAKLKDASWGPVVPVATSDASSPAVAIPSTGAEIDLTAFPQVREIADKSPGLVALPLDAAALSHSRGPGARFADVRIVDRASRQVPYLLERRDEPLSIDLTIAPASKEQAGLPTGRSGNRSVYVLKLPYPNMPPAALVVETTARVFQRNILLGVARPPDRQRRDPWFDNLAASAWRHADQQTPSQALSLRVPTVNATELLLIVDEGDNAPLPLGSARLLLPSYRVRFFHPPDADLRIAYGRNDLVAPQYDLTLLAGQIMGASAREVTAGPERSGATTEAPLVSPPFFWAFLGAAVVALLALIVRLMKA